MTEFYDLEIEKEDFIKVVKYFLTANKETFYKDLADRDKLKSYPNISFDVVKGIFLTRFETFDYCLLDDIKYYAESLNEDLKYWNELAREQDNDNCKFILDLFYCMDRNEQNCLTKAWMTIDSYLR